MQIQSWRWHTLRSTASPHLANFLRAFRRACRYGAKLFASWHDPDICKDDEAGAVRDDGTIDRPSRGEADSTVNEWEFDIPLFAASLPQGLRKHRLVMRRKANGKWQYRAPTSEEEENYVACESW
jgi:hypothetical protein